MFVRGLVYGCSMSKKRSKNAKNWAAIRRKSRRVERQDGQRERERLIPPSGLGGVTMIDCVAEGNGMGGVHTGPGVQVTSIGGTYRNNGQADVINQGRFDSYGDTIGADSQD